MAYGPRMQFMVGEHTVLMRPYREEEAERLLVGMQSWDVIKTLGLYSGQTLQDEAEFLERCRTNKDNIVWAITIVTEDVPDGLPIGTSGLDLLPGKGAGVSGSVIYDRSWWRKGIATHTHKARTFFAFEKLGLLELRSAYMQGNIASARALRSSGYEETGGFELRGKCIDGVWQPVIHLLNVNPSEGAWSYAWGGMEPPPHLHAGRKRCMDALTWAREHISWP